MSHDNTPLYIGTNEIQRLEEYVYLGHQIRLGEEKQQAERIECHEQPLVD